MASILWFTALGFGARYLGRWLRTERSWRILDALIAIVMITLAVSLVLPVLGEFMQAYPDIELDLDFSDRLVDVIEEGFDAVVRSGEPADSRLSARRLGAFELMLVASPDYLARRGTPQVPADLLEHACLHYRFPNSGKLETWPLIRSAGEPELQLPTSMICNNIETRLCFALQGRGIACLPDFSARRLSLIHI